MKSIPENVYLYRIEDNETIWKTLQHRYDLDSRDKITYTIKKKNRRTLNKNK